MAENLNYDYNVGTAKSYCYDDKIENCQKYGRLYTWAAAMDSAAIYSDYGKGCGFNRKCSPTYPVQGVCPDGWHLPDFSEWSVILGVVGVKNLGIITSPKSRLLKSRNGWSRNGNGTDSLGFTVLPAGYHYYENFKFKDELAMFWTSNDEHRKATFTVNFFYDRPFATILENRKNHAISVRCIKD